MFNRIQIREIIAWLTLVLAIALFSVSIAFAQTKTINVENKDGKVRVRINKIENGKKVDIDTTITLTDEMDIDDILKDLDGGDDVEVNHIGKNSTIIHIQSDKGSGKRGKQITLNIDAPEMTKAEKRKLHDDLKESMQEVRKGMSKLKESLQDLHIHFNNDYDKENDFHFDFDLPDFDFYHSDDCNSNSYSYHFSQSDADESDSLEDKNHIVIIGKKDEHPPVLEKIVTSKNGKQIFIYKRSGEDNESNESEKSSSGEKQRGPLNDLYNLYYYPNPTSGKFKLMFLYDKKSDITVQILDNNSKEVYTETLLGFEGDYNREIDLSGKSKGNYVIKISQNGKSTTRKIVLN